MTVAEVVNLLDTNQNPRGIANWEKMFGQSGLKSFGIGLTQLRKLATQVGKDPALAKTLWESDIYDARVIGLLIDDPKKMTRAQVEKQVDGAMFGMMVHVFCSCDAPLAKTSFVRDMAAEWAKMEQPLRRRGGYLLMGELSKDKKDKLLTDDYFLPYIDVVEKTIHQEENQVKEAMLAFLLYVGQRNLALNIRGIAAAKKIGRVDIDYGDTSCEPVDVLKHLTKEHVQKKVGAI